MVLHNLLNVLVQIANKMGLKNLYLFVRHQFARPLFRKHGVVCEDVTMNYDKHLAWTEITAM
jgi:hypothetical protein